MLATAGLSRVLLDIHRQATVAVTPSCRLLLKEAVFAWGATNAGPEGSAAS